MAQTKTKKAKASRRTAASSGASPKAARKPTAASKSQVAPKAFERQAEISLSQQELKRSRRWRQGHTGRSEQRGERSRPGSRQGEDSSARRRCCSGGHRGWVVIGSTHSGGKVLGVSLPKPKRVKIRSKDLAKAAKEVGRFGENVGELTAEFRRVREGLAGGDGKQNSPLEILLKGLTTRR